MNNPLPVQPMPSTRRSKRWLLKLLPALSLLALVLLIGIVVAIFLALGVQLETQLDTVRVFKPWGIAIQGGLIVPIGLRWTQVVNWVAAEALSRSGSTSKSMRRAARSC